MNETCKWRTISRMSHNEYITNAAEKELKNVNDILMHSLKARALGRIFFF